jgi:hypothetical protein
VLVGEPLIEISAANHFAKAGDIIAGPSAWELIKEDCDADPFNFELEPDGNEDHSGNAVTEISLYMDSQSAYRPRRYE